MIQSPTAVGLIETEQTSCFVAYSGARTSHNLV